MRIYFLILATGLLFFSCGSKKEKPQEKEATEVLDEVEEEIDASAIERRRQELVGDWSVPVEAVRPETVEYNHELEANILRQLRGEPEPNNELLMQRAADLFNQRFAQFRNF